MSLYYEEKNKGQFIELSLWKETHTLIQMHPSRFRGVHFVFYGVHFIRRGAFCFSRKFQSRYKSGRLGSRPVVLLLGR